MTMSMSPIPSSLQLAHAARNEFQMSDGVDERTKSRLMARLLYRRFQERSWLQPDATAARKMSLGIAMRVGADREVCPIIALPEDGAMDDLRRALRYLDVEIVFTMCSELTSIVFKRIEEDKTEFSLTHSGITVPIVSSLDAVVMDGTGVNRRDFCCILLREKAILIWSQSIDGIISKASEVESNFMSMIWGSPVLETPRNVYQPQNPFNYHTTKRHSPGHSGTPSVFSSSASEMNKTINEKWVRLDEVDLAAEDEEHATPRARPFLLTHSVMVGLAMTLLLVIESLAVRHIVIELKAIGKVELPHLGLLATLPVFMWFTLFVSIVVIGAGFQLFGPMSDVKSGNSRFFSSRKPDIKRHPNMTWPHITIQMPVYKEGLKGVIIPTIESLIPAIRHYESLGGTASIFVCEDGMQAVKPEVAEMRKAFYKANDIGWCARPPHNQDGYIRAGKFKKASNMNYGLAFSARVEDELLRLMKHKAQAENRSVESFTVEEEDILYGNAMAAMLEADGGKTWADGNVRMGEIILIIDCDTRVPVDCLYTGALEMEESPDVAIIQHSSGVMQVVHTLFENAITYFTNQVYLLIRFSVGSGDCAPFVGHNAFLRWKAIQSVSFQEDGVEKFWSESHVSEDFDMSLRLQTAGFVVRLASYSKGDFKEGVSLTAFDELLRWEKYSYGCSELIFHPVYKWLYKGPFTPLFRRFLFSNMKMSAKFTILGYIGTYYAIGAALPLCLINYILTGWIMGSLDHIYQTSWNVLCGTLFIFLVLSPIAFAWYRHRIGNKKFFAALFEAAKWIPFFLIFFGGLSWHISYALLAHMFVLPIEWSSTAKELEEGGMFVGIERVLKAFKYVLVFMICLLGGIIYLAGWAPYGWKINSWTSILPIANLVVGHIALPVVTILF